MYNEEQKVKFIRYYTDNLNTARTATTIFNALEKYEREWQADLCTINKEQLQPVIDEVAGLRTKSHLVALIVLKEYVKWCTVMKVPGVSDGMLQINSVGLEKVRRQMISNPYHLQKYLDELFYPESDEMIDNTYRCYYWMAYGGIEEEDVFSITKDDICFKKMEIMYKGMRIPIYREAMPAFMNAALLTSFKYKHPLYSKTIQRERTPGGMILRGIKTDPTANSLRTTLAKFSQKAVKNGYTNQRLSFGRIKMSGLFYRMYERERAGIPMDFSDAAMRAMEGKEYKLSEKGTLVRIQRRIELDYELDYQRWKLAFSY